MVLLCICMYVYHVLRIAYPLHLHYASAHSNTLSTKTASHGMHMHVPYVVYEHNSYAVHTHTVQYTHHGGDGHLTICSVVCTSGADSAAVICAMLTYYPCTVPMYMHTLSEHTPLYTIRYPPRTYMLYP